MFKTFLRNCKQVKLTMKHHESRCFFCLFLFFEGICTLSLLLTRYYLFLCTAQLQW